MLPPKFVALGIFAIASAFLPIPAHATSMTCADGSVLKWQGGRDQMTTFFYRGNSFTLAYTAPYGATFDAWGDTQSPKGTGVSMSNHGVSVIISGKHYSCRGSKY